jgi:hypothetical protein
LPGELGGKLSRQPVHLVVADVRFGTRTSQPGTAVLNACATRQWSSTAMRCHGGASRPAAVCAQV